MIGSYENNPCQNDSNAEEYYHAARLIRKRSAPYMFLITRKIKFTAIRSDYHFLPIALQSIEV